MATLTWQQSGPVEGRQALGSIRDLVFSSGHLFGLNVYGEVWRFDDKQGWRQEIKSAIPSGVGIHIYANAWGGQLCGIGSDGRVLALEQRATVTWSSMSEPEPKYAFKAPIGAYDPSRGIVVVWGSRKSDGSRRDETYLFDGTGWKKAKKPKVIPADLTTTQGGAFTMFYDPAAKAIVRVGITEVATFDGASWNSVPLANGTVLGTFDRMPCIDEATGSVLLVQRHSADLNIAKLALGTDRAQAIAVAKLPPAVTRASGDPGANVAFDQHTYDAAQRSLVVFDTKLGFRYVADLGPLFEST